MSNAILRARQKGLDDLQALRRQGVTITSELLDNLIIQVADYGYQAATMDMDTWDPEKGE
jgi:hypothetical protein